MARLTIANVMERLDAMVRDGLMLGLKICAHFEQAETESEWD